MRDLVAGLIALLLLAFAGSLVATLQLLRYRRERLRHSEQALGRRIIAEIPSGDDLVLFSEDGPRFYFGDQPIDKDIVRAVRVLINGVPIASTVAERLRGTNDPQPTGFEDRPEGIARDRWDVAIETLRGTTIVPCGAIRERVSQELARSIYDAVRKDVAQRDHD